MSVDHVLVAKCRVEDVSDNGMKISVQYAEDMPNEFILLLTGPRGGVRRLCKVVRREVGVLGVITTNIVVGDVVQKARKGSRILQKVCISDDFEVNKQGVSAEEPTQNGNLDLLSADVSLDLAEYRLLRRIGQFGAHFGTLPLKFKFDSGGVAALVSRGLVEKGPSGWPGVPAYRVTAVGGRALREWTPDDSMVEHGRTSVQSI